MSDSAPDEITFWDAAAIASPERLDDDISHEYAVLLLNCPFSVGGPQSVFSKFWDQAVYRVAADGAANYLRAFDGSGGSSSDAPEPGWTRTLNVIVGDLDSLTEETAEFYTTGLTPTTIIADSDQNSTDFFKAVMHIRSRIGPKLIIVMGSLDGRVDQGVSQLHHLYLFQKDDPHYQLGQVLLFTPSSVVFLLKAGKHAIKVRGEVFPAEDAFTKYVGILPLAGPAVISTEGLEWDVKDWETQFGGQVSTSNHVLPDTQVVTVQTDADVLFTIALNVGGQ